MMSRYLYSSACHLSRYIIKTIIESGNQEEKGKQDNIKASLNQVTTAA